MVLMLSIPIANSSEKIRKKAKGIIFEEITKPTFMCEYSHYKDGVDLADYQ